MLLSELSHYLRRVSGETVLLRKHGLFQAEKRYRTMVLVKKFKTSSLDIVVREAMGFGQKWLSEPWGFE